MDNNPNITPQPINEHVSYPSTVRADRKTLRKRIWAIVGGSVLVCLVVVTIVYAQLLRPVDLADTTKRQVTIESGSTLSDISATLHDAGVIRHPLAFTVYTRLRGIQGDLQAGIYELGPNLSTQDVAAMMVEGPEIQDFEVTFLPGATVADGRMALIDAGFAEAEVDAALNKRYKHPLFSGRPASADLEGYLYGDTRRFTSDTPVETVLTQFFDDFYGVVEQNDLIAKYRSHGLSLYEGITLASIIQKEVTGEKDSKQVAQVFYKRLADDMSLGADSTFVFAAKKAGDPPRVDYPSPYNTRIHTGLPPGPISTPGVEALLATASPARGDYLYFVSGDDGKNYFSRTEEDHIKNTKRHCKENCALF